MTEREYRSMEGVSRSDLMLIGKSPEKYLYEREHPKPSTAAQLFGILAHMALLEPDRLNDEFIVAPNVDKRTKAGKEAWAALEDEKGDRQVILSADYETALQMAQRARETPFVSKLLTGEVEKPVFWRDDPTEEMCKARLDCLTKLGDKLIIVDYKTTTDASTEGFSREAIRYGYDLQAAMYLWGVRLTTGINPTFMFIAQEKEPPYAVNVFCVDDLFIKRGEDLYRSLMDIYHVCRTSGNWYGYLGADKQINTIYLPAWAEKQLD